jgi:hypothetical protein
MLFHSEISSPKAAGAVQCSMFKVQGWQRRVDCELSSGRLNILDLKIKI